MQTVTPNVPTPSITSGDLRSLILMRGISSIFESFKERATPFTVPHTRAAEKSTKVRSLTLPKGVVQSAVDGKKAGDSEAVVVDLGKLEKNPGSYGAVFTSEPDDGPCWHCRREVGRESNRGRKVGIVLRVRDDRFHHLLIVDVEGRACNTSCELKFIRDHVGENICYEGRETALLQINEICSPGTPLVAAPDWRMLKMNGGPFTDEQFDREVRTFVPTPNLQFRLCELMFGPS